MLLRELAAVENQLENLEGSESGMQNFDKRLKEVKDALAIL